MAWIGNATNAGSHVLLLLCKMMNFMLKPHLEISDQMKNTGSGGFELQIETASDPRLKTLDNMTMKVYWANKNLGIFLSKNGFI